MEGESEASGGPVINEDSGDKLSTMPPSFFYFFNIISFVIIIIRPK